MEIRHLKISHFRGIRSLNWSITQDLVCLIGKGDSTKSTILDAIRLTLLPRWNSIFTDADFYDSDVTNPLEIIVTIGQLPDSLIHLNKFGENLRGWSNDGLVDEPAEGMERVLSIALRVDNTLEPDWLVVNDRIPQGVGISHNDRRRLGATWLGTYVDQDLSWGKQSALSRLSGNEQEISSVLANASRKARETIADAELGSLNRAAEDAEQVARLFGVKPRSGFLVGLDSKLSVTGQATLTLHDGQVPARMSGLGSRRLINLAIQHKGVPEGGIMLIDEIELGLEPHRLRHLLRLLRSTEDSTHQVFLTTHSSVSIEELKAEELHIVHNNSGEISIKNVPHELQGLMRRTSEAFLSKAIIVCEGPTEVGFVRGLDKLWQEKAVSAPFSYKGIVPTDGRGHTAPQTAIGLAELGYEVALFCDSDQPLAPTQIEIESAGVALIQWADGVSIEERICLDLPFDSLNEFIRGAIASTQERQGQEQAVLDSIGSAFGINSGMFAGKVQTLVDDNRTEIDVRREVGKKAKRNGWFKNIEGGEQLCELVMASAAEIAGSDLIQKIEVLKAWVNA